MSLRTIWTAQLIATSLFAFAVDRGDLERGAYYAENTKIVASDLKRAGLDAKWWRMSGKKYMVIQGEID
jgi:hypothetical protein